MVEPAKNGVGLSKFGVWRKRARTDRQSASLCLSIGVHLALLAWLVHSSPPVFVSSTWVRQGWHGSSLSYIYFPGNPEVSRPHLPARLYLPLSRPSRKPAAQPDRDSKYEADSNRSEAALLPSQRPGGAMYGSLFYGTLSGPDVRAALPVVFPDPVIDPSELAGNVGDVVVEITIDDQGNVLQETLIRGLSPSIDQKVLAAVGRWRFRPATRNSVPIASKQDVYYHFPR